jgi:diacylglycerol O-acyltransferase-1
MTTVRVSSLETPSDGVTHRRTNDKSPEKVNGTANGASGGDPGPNGNADLMEQLRRSFRRKYRHVDAIHSVSKPSCLSHDATDAPSFIGFRNLMVIMLGMVDIFSSAYAGPSIDMG